MIVAVTFSILLIARYIIMKFIKQLSIVFSICVKNNKENCILTKLIYCNLYFIFWKKKLNFNVHFKKRTSFWPAQFFGRVKNYNNLNKKNQNKYLDTFSSTALGNRIQWKFNVCTVYISTKIDIIILIIKSILLDYYTRSLLFLRSFT